jgi:hypothetical protein
MAADIHMPGLTLQQMYEAALEIPQFAGGGIGAYDGDFLHVDVRDHQGALGACARPVRRHTSVGPRTSAFGRTDERKRMWDDGQESGAAVLGGCPAGVLARRLRDETPSRQPARCRCYTKDHILAALGATSGRERILTWGFRAV